MRGVMPIVRAMRQAAIRDLRELLGGRIDVDRRVGAEDDVPLGDEHVHAAHELRASGCAPITWSAGRIVSG